jgi:hypothetical protein
MARAQFEGLAPLTRPEDGPPSPTGEGEEKYAPILPFSLGEKVAGPPAG